ncbi:MAG: shikimate kinase [Clostridiales bacterium]|nr:shikimate kinase [Clostridiales bacterium]
MNHVYLVGFMGSGKSTVGLFVAEKLGMPFIDLDARIETAAGMSVVEMFEARGEEAFRAAESAALESLAFESPSVVACGGGIILHDANRRALQKTGVVVYLRVGAEEAIARIGDTSGRPLLARGDAVTMASTLLGAREALYRAVADVTVDTSGVAAHDVAARVVECVSALLAERGA